MESVSEAYQRWLRAVHGPAHARRTAEHNAGFLLRHLEVGIRVLDVGCGPGSITVGLADAVAPGEVLGIDTSSENIDAAHAARKRPHLRFAVGDALTLPHPGGSFDAALAHAVLQHLDDPAAALEEVRRVVGPRGLVAVADADLDGALLWPSCPALDRAQEVMRGTRRQPDIGRRLRGLLEASGFIDVVVDAVPRVVATSQAVEATGAWNAFYFAGEPFVAHAVDQGWATEEEMAAAARAWRSWSHHPGAVLATWWFEAVARAPA